MTRQQFMGAIIGGAVAVKAVGETTPDGAAPQPVRLLAIEHPDPLSGETVAQIKSALAPYERKYGVEFLIMSGGFRLADLGVIEKREPITCHCVRCDPTFSTRGVTPFVDYHHWDGNAWHYVGG